MNKSELINYIASAANLDLKQAENALNAFWQAIAESLQKGETITLVGNGTFGTRQIPARVGINPKTKQSINIPAKTRIYFKAGKKLKELIDKK